ncbi:unnamed protein product [Orchesella dallaii]|uniref:Gustatory receptor n=1 Tax=Orchesella dallaii TaxID=48710 RepID=A0ABP1RHA9_9HEXA
MDLMRTAARTLLDPNSDMLAKLSTAHLAMFHFQIFLTYVYFMATSIRLIAVLKEWNQVVIYLINICNPKHQALARMLMRELITPIILFTVGIIESVFYDVNFFDRGHFSGKPLLEKYFYKSSQFLSNYIPYHPIFAVLFITLEKSGILAWSYGDIFLIFLCRLCTKQLHELDQYLREKVEGAVVCSDDGKFDWERIRVLFIRASNSLQKVANYVAPLAFLCYSYNTFELIVDVFYVLSGNIPLDSLAGTYLSILQLTLRISLVTYHVADMHHSFRSVADVLTECPSSFYDLSAQRLEKFLDTKQFGVHLCGTILITRKFFISIISFIFTTEIILLQSLAVKTSNGNSG